MMLGIRKETHIQLPSKEHLTLSLFDWHSNNLIKKALEFTIKRILLL